MQASDVIPTIRIKPSHPSQGEFVEINADDFDPAIHEEFNSVGSSAAKAPDSPVSKPARKGKRKA